MEMMVVDREHKGVARAEVERHLQSCASYSKQHGQPCFLVSVAVLPGSQTEKPKNVSIWRWDDL